MRSETDIQQSKRLGQVGIPDGTSENLSALRQHDLDVEAEAARKRERDKSYKRKTLQVPRSNAWTGGAALGHYIRNGGIAGALVALLLVFVQPVPGGTLSTLIAGAGIGAMLGCACFVAGRVLEWTMTGLVVLLKAALGVIVLLVIAAVLGIV